MEEISVFWFRRDLRLFDNTALSYATHGENKVLPIFIFDSEILSKLNDPFDARVSFLHDEIQRLKGGLKNLDSDLEVFYGAPIDCFKELSTKYKIKAIYSNRDYEPAAIERDAKIEALMKLKGAEFYNFKDQVIFEKDEVLTDQSAPYKVFTPYKRKWLRKLEQTILDEMSIRANFIQFQAQPMPSLEQLGFKKSSIIIPSRDLNEAIVSRYSQDRDFPALDATSKIGIHLRFGTISIRHMVKAAKQLDDIWLSELIWREFYMMILSHFPFVVNEPFQKKFRNVPWRDDKEGFDAWCSGNTGYPMVDAGMRQINKTGFMHNRLRMVTASFLTKHLLIDWRWGEAYFAEKLLDFELASNNGGWQWSASTGTDAQPYFRVFSPESQFKRFDSKAEFVKEWVPEWGTLSYGQPIVDHKFARLRAIETFKQAALDQ